MSPPVVVFEGIINRHPLVAIRLVRYGDVHNVCCVKFRGRAFGNSVLRFTPANYFFLLSENYRQIVYLVAVVHCFDGIRVVYLDHKRDPSLRIAGGSYGNAPELSALVNHIVRPVRQNFSRNVAIWIAHVQLRVYRNLSGRESVPILVGQLKGGDVSQLDEKREVLLQRRVVTDAGRLKLTAYAILLF